MDKDFSIRAKEQEDNQTEEPKQSKVDDCSTAIGSTHIEEGPCECPHCEMERAVMRGVVRGNMIMLSLNIASGIYVTKKDNSALNTCGRALLNLDIPENEVDMIIQQYVQLAQFENEAEQ